MTYEERVEYFGQPDDINGYWFNKSLSILRSRVDLKDHSINDIIEEFNILRHIESYVNNTDLDIQARQIVNLDMVKTLNKEVAVYFSKMDDKNICDFYDKVDYRYFETFWELIDKYKVYERISVETFEKLLCNPYTQIEDVLIHEKIVRKFDKSLREYLLSSANKAIDVIIEKFFIENSKKKLFLPLSMANDDYNIIFNKYLDSKEVGLNLVEKIYNLPVVDGCVVSDEIRAKALNKYNSLVKDLFDKNQGIKFDFNVSISKTMPEMEAFIYESNNEKICLTISYDWIKNNLDYATLLNNFIHIFKFVDNQLRISLVSKFYDLGFFEKLGAEDRIKDSYLTGSSFDMMNSFAIVEITAYIEQLKNEHNIRIEEVLQWFFDKYLLQEFGIKDFNVFLPLAERTYLESCRTMSIEIESTIKQFNSFVKYGYVNHNVIEAFSTQIDYSSISSLIPNKYIYPNANNCGPIMRLLFSSQSALTYLPKSDKNYKCFYEAVYLGNVKLDDFPEFSSDSLQDLIRLNIIKIDEKNFIRFVDIKEVFVLFDLYKNEFAVTNFYNKLGLQETISSLLNKGWVRQGSSLFSTQESEFINYYLNKKVSNGLNLRNLYLHGTQPQNGTDEVLNKTNYYRLLLIYILIIIKINDELCDSIAPTTQDND